MNDYGLVCRSQAYVPKKDIDTLPRHVHSDYDFPSLFPCLFKYTLNKQNRAKYKQ